MARIFFGLALFAVALLIGTLVLGYVTGDFNQVATEWIESGQELRRLDSDPNASQAEVEAIKEKKAELHSRFKALKKWVGLHTLVGIAASLVAVLVNSITVTYFIGTSRWCTEVVDTYSLPLDFVERSKGLKRKSFPWSLIGIVTVLALAAFGAACHPGINDFQSAGRWVSVHHILGWVGTLVIAWSLLVQVGSVGANYEIIDEILGEVQRIREAKGLANDEAESSKPPV